jgi:hypothetical protein
VHPYLSEKLAQQRHADLCARAARSRRASQARYARRARQARARGGHRHLIRRRAGWALVSLGLRLAYVAGED